MFFLFRTVPNANQNVETNNEHVQRRRIFAEETPWCESAAYCFGNAVVTGLASIPFALYHVLKNGDYRNKSLYPVTARNIAGLVVMTNSIICFILLITQSKTFRNDLKQIFAKIFFLKYFAGCNKKMAHRGIVTKGIVNRAKHFCMKAREQKQPSRLAIENWESEAMIIARKMIQAEYGSGSRNPPKVRKTVEFKHRWNFDNPTFVSTSREDLAIQQHCDSQECTDASWCDGETRGLDLHRIAYHLYNLNPARYHGGCYRFW